VFAVAFSPDGKTLAVGLGKDDAQAGASGELQLWRTADLVPGHE
jgi:hypothetical protein